MVILINIYLIGVLVAILRFTYALKKQTPLHSYFDLLLYVLGDNRHLKYTLQSWLYFFKL